MGFMSKITNGKGASHVLNVIVRVIGIFSSIFLGIICLSFIITKKYKSYSFQLIFYLFIATLFCIISYIINLKDERATFIDEKPDALCKAQGFLIIIFENSEYLWGMMISINTNIALKQSSSSYFNPKLKQKILFLIIGFIFPLIVAICSLFTDNIQPIGHWCWADRKKTGLIVALYILLWVPCLINIIFTIKTILNLRNISSSKEIQERAWKTAKNLLMYPIVQLIILFVSTIIELILHENNSDISDCLKSLLYCSQGILLAFCYGYLQFGCSCCRKKDRDSIGPIGAGNENILDDSVSENSEMESNVGY